MATLTIAPCADDLDTLLTFTGDGVVYAAFYEPRPVVPPVEVQPTETEPPETSETQATPCAS